MEGFFEGNLSFEQLVETFKNNHCDGYAFKFISQENKGAKEYCFDSSTIKLPISSSFNTRYFSSPFYRIDRVNCFVGIRPNYYSNLLLFQIHFVGPKSLTEALIVCKEIRFFSDRIVFMSPKFIGNYFRKSNRCTQFNDILIFKSLSQFDNSSSQSEEIRYTLDLSFLTEPLSDFISSIDFSQRDPGPDEKVISIPIIFCGKTASLLYSLPGPDSIETTSTLSREWDVRIHTEYVAKRVFYKESDLRRFILDCRTKGMSIICSQGYSFGGRYIIKAIIPNNQDPANETSYVANLIGGTHSESQEKENDWSSLTSL